MRGHSGARYPTTKVTDALRKPPVFPIRRMATALESDQSRITRSGADGSGLGHVGHELSASCRTMISAQAGHAGTFGTILGNYMSSCLL
jgi:hypothetical protein